MNDNEKCPGCGDTTMLDDGLCPGCWQWFIDHDLSYYDPARLEYGEDYDYYMHVDPYEAVKWEP
jgi:hypothetical protein